MEHNTLFLALSSAILTSLAQGLIIYLLVWLLMKIYPAMTANQRYKIFYTALLLIFSGFIFALIRSYISGSEKAGLTLTENIILTNGNPSYIHSDPGLLYAS